MPPQKPPGRGRPGSGRVEFQRQPVRIGEEREPAPGVFVHAHRLGIHAMRPQVRQRRVQVVDPEGQVAQAAGFRPRHAWRRRGKREQLDLGAIGQAQVKLPRIARLAVGLGDHLQAQHLDIEPLRARVVGRDDRDVVDAGEIHLPIVGRLFPPHVQCAAAAASEALPPLSWRPLCINSTSGIAHTVSSIISQKSLA
jgi:hypothetical protein